MKLGSFSTTRQSTLLEIPPTSSCARSVIRSLICMPNARLLRKSGICPLMAGFPVAISNMTFSRFSPNLRKAADTIIWIKWLAATQGGRSADQAVSRSDGDCESPTCRLPNVMPITQLARDHCDKFKLYGWELGPRGEYDLTVYGYLSTRGLPGEHGATVFGRSSKDPPFYNLLDRLCTEVHEIEVAKGIETPTVPYMTEFVPFFLCDRQTSIRRKRWLMDYAR